MDVLSLLDSPDDEGVTMVYEPLIPPINLDADGNHVPPPPMFEGDASQGSHTSGRAPRLTMR